MRIISTHGLRFAALLLLFPALVFIASLLWQIGPAAAVQTYYYQGHAYDPSLCPFGTTPPCTGGSVTATVTLKCPPDIPEAYPNGLNPMY